MIHESVNLRAGAPTTFADRADRSKYEVECRDARRAQLVPYAVAPRQRVVTASGQVIVAGQEVTEAMLVGAVDSAKRAVPAWRVLRDLVASGRVLEADTMPEAG
ncbi:MAG: hypothetical protein QM756_44730 [Polyangiaceae bacterium]